MGQSLKSVEILVSVVQKNAKTPLQTESEINAFCQKAYNMALGAYSGILPKPIDRQAATARSGFRMTLDEAPYYNPSATPLVIESSPITLSSKDTPSEGQQEFDYRLYEDYEHLYKRAASEAFQKKTDHIAMLARCVPCRIPQWEMWFKKWFLYMVAQWLLPQQEYGNSVVPLLISPQGDGKPTFYLRKPLRANKHGV